MTMAVFVVLGAGVSAMLLAAMIRGPFEASLADFHVSYSIQTDYGGLIVAAYVVATCGSSVFSGYRHIATFGLVNLLAVAVLAVLMIDGFASLWCGWAALTSCAIALHLRFSSPHPMVAQARA
jgi:hypothetical protein